MRRKIFIGIWLLVFVPILFGHQIARAQSNQEPLLIFAAASLKDALDTIVLDFDRPNQIKISYASSGTLARQIAEGAPADIFISANSDWVDYLEKRKYPLTKRDIIAENQLVVATRSDQPALDVNDLLAAGRFAMGDPAHVPAGIYAKQALQHLGLWPNVSSNSVFGENVRISLRKLQRGEVNAAIIYRSDLIGLDGLKIAHHFNQNSHEPVQYIAALVQTSELASRFFSHLTSESAQDSFERFGFANASVDLSYNEEMIRPFKVDYIAIIGLSLQVAFVSMLFAIPIAFAVAYLLARVDFRGKALLQAFVMLPLVMPPVVTGYFLLVLFGTQGAIGQFLSTLGLGFGFHWTGAALAAGVMAFPLLVRPMRLAIEAIDIKLDQTAETLGASSWTRFRTIILPLSVPGIVAGGVLGFAKALGEFGATMTFVSNIPGETQTFSLAVYSLLQSPLGDEAALALIFVSASLAIAAVLISEWVSGKMLKAGGRDA